MLLNCFFNCFRLFLKKNKNVEDSECVNFLNDKNGYKIFEVYVKAEFAFENISCVFHYFFNFFLFFNFFIF
jgi:hypothetical protein